MNVYEVRRAVSEAEHEAPRPFDDYNLGFDDDWCPVCDTLRVPGDPCCMITIGRPAAAPGEP